MPYYTKTALKKFKKDELVEMILNIQAEKVNDSMDEDLKAENEKLKEKNERLDKQRVLDIQRMMKGDEYKKENEKLKAYKDYFDTWSPILRDVDGDDLCNLLSDYGWVYDDDGKLVNQNQ